MTEVGRVQRQPVVELAVISGSRAERDSRGQPRPGEPLANQDPAADVPVRPPLPAGQHKPQRGQQREQADDGRPVKDGDKPGAPGRSGQVSGNRRLQFLDCQFNRPA
jgi:hypothetical protein